VLQPRTRSIYGFIGLLVFFSSVCGGLTGVCFDGAAAACLALSRRGYSNQNLLRPHTEPKKTKKPTKS
jgi:hypothetical protein